MLSARRRDFARSPPRIASRPQRWMRRWTPRRPRSGHGKALRMHWPKRMRSWSLQRRRWLRPERGTPSGSPPRPGGARPRPIAWPSGSGSSWSWTRHVPNSGRPRQPPGWRGQWRLKDGGSQRAPGRQRGLVAVGARQTLAEWIGGAEIPGIFARVAVAPDLGALLAGWRNLPTGWSAVTVEGDLADGRGLVALRGRADPPGGNAARQGARRRQIAEELTILEPAYVRAAD